MLTLRSAGWGNEKAIASRILRRLTSRIENAETFAAVNRMLLLVNESEVGVDNIVGSHPLRTSNRAFIRLRLQELGSVTTCSAEDL